MATKDFNALLQRGRPNEALAAVLAATRRATSYSELNSLARARRRLKADGHGAREESVPLRMAFGGDATMTYLTPLLELLLESHGIAAEIYEVPYGSLQAELLQPGSELDAFAPRLLAISQTPLCIKGWPVDVASEEEAAAFAARCVEQTLSLCRAAHERLNCEVVLDNWHPLPERPHGHYARRMAADRGSLIRRMNGLLEREAPPWVHLHDVDGVAALHGVRQWIDYRFWYHAKQPIGFDAVPSYVASLAGRIASLHRPAVKCVVLDLDNTLWGGVVGDDGLAGIKIGQGDAQGEAFLAFQHYVLRLKQRGLLLAVCSKNEVENAQAPFKELPDMALRLEDFVAFKANWEPKPRNLEEIAHELNIGLDALVLVDDNPVEREHVRSMLPMVKVIDIGDDPADYPAAMDRSGLFEIVSLSAEDLERTQQYVANKKRVELASSIKDYDAYLASLEQRAEVREFDPAQLDRIAQLINKTNQFNLTTRRVTRSDVEQLMEREDVLTAAVRLRDRFGDNGIIAVWYGSVHGQELRIEQWLMSCRVLKRGVEHMLCNFVVEAARERGVTRIIGEYRPTKKNALVRDLYSRLGFQAAPTPSGAEEGAEFWQLELEDYRPFTHTIALD